MPFYDPAKTYYENLEQGPFGDFADGVVMSVEGQPRFEFLGQKINYPFGIPAGPLLGSAFIRAAFEKGFDVAVYKTVRSSQFPCHPFPNVLAVKVEGDLTLEKASRPLVADTDYRKPLSITNSFAVPSLGVEAWQSDARDAIASALEGQVMVLSFMGTVREGRSRDEFIADFAEAGRLAAETGARILEVDLSCPNFGDEGLVCYNIEMTERIAKAIRGAIGKLPLILKVGYYREDDSLKAIAEVTEKYAEAIAGINTLSAVIVDKEGNQALPGTNRKRSGVCGASIKWAGVEQVKRLKDIREKNGMKFSIVGMGGVMIPEDFKEYRDAGADLVMSATGAMWNPYLAREIIEAYPDA